MIHIFNGLWSLHRDISDGGAMTGYAHFTAIDQHIRHYYEQGIYTTKEMRHFPFDQSFRYSHST